MIIGNDFFPPFSEKELARRGEAVRASMSEKGLDCLIIYGAYSATGNDTGHVNLTYLANYSSVGQTYLILPLKADPTLIINIFLHLPNAQRLTVIKDVRSAEPSYQAVVGERLKELGLEKGNIGIVGPGGFAPPSLPFEDYTYLKQTFPQATFQTVTSWYEGFRLVKSAEEIALLERAGRITDLAQEELFLATRPGIRHTDLRRLLGGIAARHGATYPFAHIGSTSMANPQDFPPYPDFFPTDVPVEAGHVVMTELALGYGNYFGKIWVTYFMGEPTEEYRKLFEVAALVHDQAIAGLKPGMKGGDVNQFLESFKKTGFANLGMLMMGWSTYNHPPLAGSMEESIAYFMCKPFENFVFRPGHTVTIISWPFIPGTKKGVWVGSTCVFTEKGLKKFHAYPVNQLRVVPI